MRLTHRGQCWLRVCGVIVALGTATLTAQGQAQRPSEAPSQGIKVHGHWKIDVRNADGSLVSSREFENGLTPEGRLLLVRLLHSSEGVIVVGRWGVSLTGSNGPCAPGIECLVQEGDPQSGVSLSRSSRNISSLTLTGFTTVTGFQAGTIFVVGTRLSLCQGPISDLALCRDGSSGYLGTFPFSEASLDSAINVKLGQIVQFTVTFTFS